MMVLCETLAEELLLLFRSAVGMGVSWMTLVMDEKESRIGELPCGS